MVGNLSPKTAESTFKCQSGGLKPQVGFAVREMQKLRVKVGRGSLGCWLLQDPRSFILCLLFADGIYYIFLKKYIPRPAKYVEQWGTLYYIITN